MGRLVARQRHAGGGDGWLRRYWADYDDRGRPDFISDGDEYYLDDDGDPLVWLAQTFGYDADQRMDYTATWMHDTTIPDGFVAAHDLSYDAVGNVTAQDRTLNGLDWRECYGYDARHRLTEAFTVEFEEGCSEGEPGTGDQAFEHSYSYSPDGRLLERVEDGDAATYSYPTGGDQPHAPTVIDGETYTWDANGNLAERTVDGGTETFSWDVQQRLSSAQSPDGTTSFVYDTGGQRLRRQTSTGATLYFAGHEITATADGVHRHRHTGL